MVEGQDPDGRQLNAQERDHRERIRQELMAVGRPPLGQHRTHGRSPAGIVLENRDHPAGRHGDH
jgi:hypothetical protein